MGHSWSAILTRTLWLLRSGSSTVKNLRCLPSGSLPKREACSGLISGEGEGSSVLVGKAIDTETVL